MAGAAGGETPRPDATGSRFSGRLSRRLLGWFLLFSLAPLFASNTIGYLKAREIIERLVDRYLAAVAEVEARHVSDEVERHLSSLEMLAAGNEFLAAGLQRLEGRPTTNDMGRVVGRSVLQEYLEGKLAGSSGLEGLYLEGPDGTVLLAVGNLDAGSLKPRAPGGGATAPGFAPLADGPDGSARFRLAVVVWDQGRPAGLLAGVVGRASLATFLGIPRHLAGTVESFIVDDRGRPVFVSHPHGPVDYARAMATPLARAAPGARAHYLDAEGQEVVGTSVSVPGLPWRYVTQVPASDALGPLWLLRWLSSLLEALLLVVLVAAAWFVSREMVAPIRRLVAATRRVAQGDLEARVVVRSSDEIGELAHAFNEMAAELVQASERVRELHRREIERAQHLATVGELASGVAHEIKNPVVGISNGLDLVRRRIAPDPAVDPIMDEMSRQLLRIEGAVRDLLTFARPATPTLVPADANEIVRRAARLVLPAAEHAGVSIDFRLEPSLPALLLDEEQLRQALVNLVMNAVQATPAGGRITVSTRVHGGVLEIEVKDTGRGITPDDLQQIFKPFYTTRHSGTGLGLSISREIVERHGGRIEVESKLGRGSSFTVVLPAQPAAAAAALKPLEVPA
jgi:signal transduction histidine kinase